MRLPSPVLWLLLGGKGSRIPLLLGGEGRVPLPWQWQQWLSLGGKLCSFPAGAPVSKVPGSRSEAIQSSWRRSPWH